MIARPCAVPGCVDVAVQRGRCAQHAATQQHDHDQQRGSAHQRGYGARWRRVRAWVLTHQPLCLDCEQAGDVTAATEVHHRDGNNQNNHLDNLAPLCKSCHSRRTVAEKNPAARGGAKV